MCWESACTLHHSRHLLDQLPRLTGTEFSVNTARELLSAWVATEQQPEVIDVLTQKLAEQHIPLSLPYASHFQFSAGSKTAVNAPIVRQALLDRFLADAASQQQTALKSLIGRFHMASLWTCTQQQSWTQPPIVCPSQALHWRRCLCQAQNCQPYKHTFSVTAAGIVTEAAVCHPAADVALPSANQLRS
ncbi:hypothetical protein WJX77_000550 [Trebouxia sp. C0004]